MGAKKTTATKQAAIQILATDKHGNRQEITDLYFFEENYIHTFQDGGYEGYTFEIFIDDKKVYPPEYKDFTEW